MLPVVIYSGAHHGYATYGTSPRRGIRLFDMNTLTNRKCAEYLWLVFIALFISACSQAGGDVSAQKDTDHQATSDNDEVSIMQALYNNVRTPDGFYHEVLPTNGFYTISHVKNTDLLSPVDRAGVAVYELSTDDFSEALDWSETAATYQASYKALVDNTESDFYLQFTRADPAAPELMHLSRVFKRSVLDRSGVDRNADGAYQGRVALTSMNTDKLRSMVEYLWLFSFSNNYGNAVLSSSISESSDEYRHLMREARLIAGTGGACDRIDVYETLYETDRATGMIWKTRRLAHSFLAKNEAGEFSVCADGEADQAGNQ
jgi:hypothetical protein